MDPDSSSLTFTGAGESGKSTVVKQMKIIHNGGYAYDELVVFRPIVYKNLLDAVQLLVLAMKKVGVDCSDNRNRVSQPVSVCPVVSVRSRALGSILI